MMLRKRKKKEKGDKLKFVFIEDKSISDEEAKRRLNNAFDVIFKNV